MPFVSNAPLGSALDPSRIKSLLCVRLSILTRLYLSGIEESRIPSSWEIGKWIFFSCLETLDFDIDIRGFLFKICEIIIFWKISEENLKN